MATISGLTLEVEVVNDGADLVANVTAAYRINWSISDQASEQPYREVCKLVGDDSGIDPAEDGADDAIVDGQLFPQLLFPPFRPLPGQPAIPVPSGTVSSNGQPFLDRVHTKTIDLSRLDEDQDPVSNPDEIRAVVSLTPVLATAVTRESAQVLLNVG
jgi:hypothetical protein